MAPPAPPPSPAPPPGPLFHAPPVGPPSAPGTPLHMVLNSLQLWAFQSPGRATVRELRWQGAPTLVVIKRLRAEASFPLNTTIALVAKAFPSLGIPRVTDGAFSWSNRFTAWGEARALAHTTCACPASTGSAASRCPTCSCLRRSPGPIDTWGRCPWCKTPGLPACRRCCIGVHFQGDCILTRGAHRAYAPSPGSLWCLAVPAASPLL